MTALRTKNPYPLYDISSHPSRTYPLWTRLYFQFEKVWANNRTDYQSCWLYTNFEFLSFHLYNNSLMLPMVIYANKYHQNRRLK